jgi:GGDEF domain-containing protein
LAKGIRFAGAPFSVSIGVAAHEGPGADFAQMHRNADHALHQAKAEGRNRAAPFEPSMAAPLQPGHTPRVSA